VTSEDQRRQRAHNDAPVSTSPPGSAADVPNGTTGCPRQVTVRPAVRPRRASDPSICSGSPPTARCRAAAPTERSVARQRGAPSVDRPRIALPAEAIEGLRQPAPPVQHLAGAAAPLGPGDGQTVQRAPWALLKNQNQNPADLTGPHAETPERIRRTGGAMWRANQLEEASPAIRRPGLRRAGAVDGTAGPLVLAPSTVSPRAVREGGRDGARTARRDRRRDRTGPFETD